MAAEMCLVCGVAAPSADWEPPQLTAAQLHWLSRHIRALAELSRQLRAVQEGGRLVSTEQLAELGFATAAEPKQPKARSRSARKPKPAPNPKAGSNKRRRVHVKEEQEEESEASGDSGSEPEEEEAPDSDSDDAEDTEPSDAEPEPGEAKGGADSEAEPPAKRQKAKAKPSRTTGRRAAKAVRKVKQEQSDDDEVEEDFEADEADAKTGAASGPAQLVRLKATPYVPREQELCDVCGSGEGWDGNAILLCDGPGCKVALHQHCCGVTEIPEGDWLCDGCAAGVPPQAHMCLLCPVSGGALRRVGATGPVKLPSGVDASEGAWVHLACAIWTPEVYFEQAAELQGMRLDDLTAERMELLCGLCKQGGGGMVQCSFGKCTRAFHILCARQHGNVAVVRSADAMLLCFCKMHSGERFAKTRGQMIEEVPEGFEAASELPDEAPQTGPNEYEAQRERNIARNKLKLAELRKM